MSAFVGGANGRTTGNVVNVSGNNNNVLIASKGARASTNTGGGLHGAAGTYAQTSSSGGSSGGGGNSGGGGGGGGGNTNNNNNNNNADADKPQFSQDIFDYVELRLQYFADKTKYIADKITDYITTGTKGTLLRNEVKAIQEEIQANSKAATTYANFAEELARAYAYTDKDGNKQTVNIWSKFNRNDLLNGKYQLDQINTTNPADAAMVEGARAYLDYINKARDANNAIQELTNTMRDLHSQIIQLPTEKLEKSLEVIENRISTISGVTSAMESGISGMASAQRWINFATDAKALKNAEAKSAANKTKTYNTYNDKKSAYENRVKLTEISKNDLKKYLNSNKNINKNQKNTILNAMKNGKLIDYKSIKGNTFKKLVSAYNYRINKQAAAKSTMDSAYKAYQDARNKNATDQRALSNIYGQTNTLMSGSLKNPTYVTQNKNLDKEMEQLKEELKKRKEAMKEQEAVTQSFESQRSSLQKQLNDASKSVKNNSAYKNASKADKKYIDNAIKNKWKIDPTRVAKGLTTAVALWNNAQKSLESVTSALTQAREQEAKMKEELIQSAVEVAEREQKIAQEKFDNIGNWYQSLIDYSNTLAKQRDELRKAWKDRGYYIDPSQITKTQKHFITTGNKAGETRAAYSEDTGYYVATIDKNGKYVKNKSLPNAMSLTDGISYHYGKPGGPTIEANSPIANLKKNYEDQIKLLKEDQNYYAEQAKKQQELLNGLVKNGTIIKDSEEYKSMAENIQKATTEVYSLDSEINKLYDDMREDIYFKPLEKMINNIETLRKAIDQVKGMISPEMMYTTDGMFTELGTTKYAMDVRSYKTLQDEFEKNRMAQQVLLRTFGHDQYLDIDTFNSQMKEYEARAREIITSLASQRQVIIKDVTDRYQTEITYINKLIDAKKNELNKRKELYEYDKKLRKQNKDVQLIEQQIRALNGLKQ